MAEKIEKKIEQFRKEGVNAKITAKERHLSIEESAEAIENLNEDKWKAVREIDIDDKTDAVEKMGLRFEINEKNLDKLRQIIFLNEVPPTCEEAMENIRKKEKILSKSNQGSGP